MGTSRSAAQFSRKITQMATVTQTRQKQVVEQGALTGKEIVFAQAAVQGVSRGSRIAGGKWGVRYDIKGFNNPTALLKVTGPFHLVNNDTRSHFIAAKGLGGTRGRRGKQAASAAFVGAFGLSGAGAFKGNRQTKASAKGKRALAFGSSHYAYVRHPGTKGKGIWQSSVVKMNRAIPLVMSQRLVGGWRSALK